MGAREGPWEMSSLWVFLFLFLEAGSQLVAHADSMHSGPSQLLRAGITSRPYQLRLWESATEQKTWC